MTEQTNWQPFESAPKTGRQIEVMGSGKYPHRFKYDRVDGEWFQLVGGNGRERATWHRPFFIPKAWREIPAQLVLVP